MPKILTLLINLDGSNDRLAHASTQLRDAGIEFERFQAFDARGVPALSFENYDEVQAIKFYGRPMSGGEIGCYKSHLMCAEKFLASDANYALVLEDDMELVVGAKQTIEYLVSTLDNGAAKGWHLVNR